MSTIVKIKRGSGKPSSTNLSEWELGYDRTNKRMYINNNKTVEEIASTKLDMYDVGQEIEASSTSKKDLNDYKDVGVFYCNQNKAPYVNNKPTTTTGGFKLVVIQGYATSYFLQIFIHGRNGAVYTRAMWQDTSTKVWTFSNWGATLTDVQDTIQEQIYNNVYSNLYKALNTDLNKVIDAGVILGLGTDLTTLADSSKKIDLNNIKTQGKYHYTSTTGYTISNCPLNTGFALYVIEDYDTGRATQILFNNEKYYHRSCTKGGAWKPDGNKWYEFTQSTVSSLPNS